MECSPWQVLPHTTWVVLFVTVRNRFGDGVNRLGSMGSSVIVGRNVAVNVGTGVSVTSGVPVERVLVGCCVLMTNKFGVKVVGSANGVAVGCGELMACGAGVCRNGILMGSPLQPDRREISNRKNKDFFITPLR